MTSFPVSDIVVGDNSTNLKAKYGKSFFKKMML